MAARNVLVGDEDVCKITDFGMARDVWEEDIYVRTHEVLLYDIFYSTSIRAVGLKSALFKLVFFLILDYRAVFRLSGRQLRLCLEMVHILLRVMCEFVLSFLHPIHKQSSKYHQDILIIFPK